MLNVKNMSIQYGDELVLEDISFEAEKGEITILIGPNGVGKTSVIKAISGLINSTGQVYLNSELLTKTNRLSVTTRMGYLSQDNSCHAELSVFDIVLLGRLERLSLKVKDEEVKKTYEIIEEMNLSNIVDKNINELSGGQRQMAFIAQTLVSEPNVLLLDEPINNLDFHKQYELLNYIQKITRERSIVTIIILHQLDLAAQYGNKIIVFKDTSIYSEGTPADTITTKMLEDVFKVRGKIIQEKNGSPHIIVSGSIN